MDPFTPDAHPPPVTPTPNGHPRLPYHSDGECANCAKAGAVLICMTCQILDIGLVQTYYCDNECQMEHWITHQLTCSERQKLGRAVTTLCKIWDEFCQITYSNTFQFQAASEGFINTERRNDPVNPRALAGQSIFYPFPGDVVPENAGAPIINGMLHDSMCVDILNTGLPLIETLLEPLCNAIAEISILPKDPAMRVVKSNRLEEVDHMVLFVRLHNNEEFAVDVTGSQFGWQERLYTWRDYMTHRGTFQISLHLGSCREYADDLQEGIDPESVSQSSFDLRRRFAQDAAKAIQDFFNTNNTTATEFMSFGNPDFAAQNMELIRAADLAVRQAIDDMIVRRGIGRMCLFFYSPESSRPVAVRDEELARRMEAVWFTCAEVEANRGNLGLLQAEMYNRLQSAHI